MEHLIPFTLFGSGIAFGFMLIILLFTLVVSDLNEAGEYAFFAFIIVLGLNFFWGTFNIVPLLTWTNVLMYIFIGFLFSILRTWAKGISMSQEDKKYFKLKDHVFRWWFLFPICAINWVFGSLLRDLWDFIYKKVGVFYALVFNYTE